MAGDVCSRLSALRLGFWNEKRRCVKCDSKDDQGGGMEGGRRTCLAGEDGAECSVQVCAGAGVGG